MPKPKIEGLEENPKPANPFKETDLSKLKTVNWKDVEPLGQHVIVEPIPDVTEYLREKMTKEGLIIPELVAEGRIQDQGLSLGVVVKAPQDQNLLMDKTRPVNFRSIKIGDLVWYSSYSASRMIDWRKDRQGELLDLVPLEDLQALIVQE